MTGDGRFDDGKDEGALRTIGEVAKALDIKPHVLRYWEQQFPQLSPVKRAGGRRYYRPAHIAVVERIDRLVNREGYTLKGAAGVLESAGISATATVDTERGIAGGDTTIRADAPQLAREMAADEAGALPLVMPVAADVIPAETIARLKSIRAGLAAALEG